MRLLWTPSLKGAAAFVFAAGAAIGAGGPVAAQEGPIACGGKYRVVAGDTLSLIAQRAYGPTASFEDLYRVNSRTIGGDPSRLQIDMVLDVPCRDGSGEVAAAAPATPVAVPTAAPARASEIGALRIVTADNWRPYTDETDPNGGMVPDIVGAALSNVAAESDYRIDFVNDWGAHLDPLIVDGMFDVSVPWVKPDCDAGAYPDDEVAFRCERLAWSDPLFEIVSAVYVKRAAEGGAADDTSINGKTICLPADHAINGLVRLGFAPPIIEIVREDSPEDCIEAVATGEAFGTLLTTSVAEDAMQETGLADQIYEVPSLSIVDTIHAVTAINNPRREETLALLNAGIAAVRENGQWFEIVQRHLIKHKAKTR
ncbi:MAG: transporter substrate-binding domain-containing protein [Pseudomonadota bacterium]